MKSTDKIFFENQNLMIKTWAKKKGLKLYTLMFRLRNGWEVYKAMNTPSQRTSKLITQCDPIGLTVVRRTVR